MQFLHNTTFLSFSCNINNLFLTWWIIYDEWMYAESMESGQSEELS